MFGQKLIAWNLSKLAAVERTSLTKKKKKMMMMMMISPGGNHYTGVASNFDWRINWLRHELGSGNGSSVPNCYTVGTSFDVYNIKWDVMRDQPSLRLFLMHLSTMLSIFTVRRSAWHGLCGRNSVRPSVRLSVRPSVCLSHSCTVSTWFNLRS